MIISLRRLRARDRTWLQKSKSLGTRSNGKQLEQYRKVRCYWMLQEANRAAQPWKPPQRQVSSDGTCRTSEGRAELPNPHLLPSSASRLLPLPSRDEASAVGRWRGTVNQDASPGSRDRLLKHLSIKINTVFPPQKMYYFLVARSPGSWDRSFIFKNLSPTWNRWLTSTWLQQIATVLNSGYAASENKQKSCQTIYANEPNT